MTGSLQRELGGAVQAALQSALPQQLAGPALQQALELALGSHLQAALQTPLQTAFRSSFEQRLIPAFEGACQSMFSQASRHPVVLSAACIRVMCAVAGKHLSSHWQLLTSQTVAVSDKLLADCNALASQALIGPPLLQQVQATFAGGLSDHLQAAGGANAAVAASLQESLAAATSLAETLRDEVAEGQRKLVALAEEDRGVACVQALCTSVLKLAVRIGLTAYHCRSIQDMATVSCKQRLLCCMCSTSLSLASRGCMTRAFWHERCM